MRTLKLFLLLSSAIILTSPLFGQGVSTGDLRVSVTDPQGQPVANASVSARNGAKGIERVASGNGEGQYSFLSLPPGSYVVTVNAQGFSKASAPDVVITVGGSLELPISLTLASTTETVEVSSAAQSIETAQTSTTDTVNERQIDNLPINGRNYINFTLTDSQVVRDNAPNIGAAPTSGLNISGQRGRSNLVNVDGADATDNSVNGVRSTVSQEAVQEFQIITNGYQPEYGRAAGGVVNIVTKSGSNAFHGDAFGYLRNRNFQAVNPFSTVSNPAYTRVQAGTAFGGAIKKDKTFFYFSYEITRRHETGFSSIGAQNFGLVPFDTTNVGLPFQTLQLSPDQIGFLTNPAVIATEQASPAYANEVGQYAAFVGATSGMAVNGAWPTTLTGGVPGVGGFITSCSSPPCFVPASYQSLASQVGNFPVFEGTSVYSLRLDHNISTNNRLTFRTSVSPSTVTGIEVSGEDQPFGQNAYSRTSQQTFRDVTAVAQDTWTLSGNKLNEFRFQYARRGLSYFYNTAIPGGSDPAVNITGIAYFGREPYSYIQRAEQRYQFADNFSWTIGQHNTKLGGDLNYLLLNATFTVNYGGVYDFGSLDPSIVASFGFVNPSPGNLPNFPGLSAVQAYGAGVPGTFVQGLGSPTDSFTNVPIGLYWQDSWRVRRNLTLNYGLRYDVEIPPKFKAPTGLGATGYKFLGLQKGIQTDTNNFQPRVGLAWDPKGDGKTVIRSSYGMFYDHPLLGLYFLGNASDGSTSGQLAFVGTGLCSSAGDPGNLNAITIFQGLVVNPGAPQCAPSTSGSVNAALGYLSNQQQFQALNFPQSAFLNQNYLTNTPLALAFQPFGYPQGDNFVYAYAQQANLSVERDLGHGFAINLAYNFNGGRHLNRPINANTQRGDLMVANLLVAEKAAQAAGIQPTDPRYPTNPYTVGTSTAYPPCGVVGGQPYVPASLMNFFRPSGLNPSIAGALIASGGSACVGLAEQILQGLKSQGFNAACDPLSGSLTGCIPFGDMDANFSNGSSVYHGLSVNLRKRFETHYEFLASYTWSHAIDDSTDLQAPLTPQDSYFPGLDRSTSLFDQRHRFVFSGVYNSGHMGDGLAGRLLSDWTFAPLIEFGAGRPFNILTGNGDNLQAESLTGRPNTFVNPACGPGVNSKYSPTGVFQEPCITPFVMAGVVPTLQALDGNLGRNAGITPWTVFNDIRVARKIRFNERMNLDAMVDIFNIANRYNVAAVSPLYTNAGQPTAAYDPRQIQFGLRVNW